MSRPLPSDEADMTGDRDAASGETSRPPGTRGRWQRHRTSGISTQAEPGSGSGERSHGRRRWRAVETSAGGLVIDAMRSNAVLIGRLDRSGRLRWSLPKGHIETGETPELAAIREVAEETGITSRVLVPLGTINYWFNTHDRHVHKTVHHFLMQALGGELCDQDHEVTEVAWIPLSTLHDRMAYRDERRLVRLALDLLANLT